MLLGHHQTIDDRVVEELALKPGQTAAELLERIRGDLVKKPTMQGWYKALRRLLEREVLIKDGKTYSLNIRWVSSLNRLAERAGKSYLNPTAESVIRMPVGRGRVTYRFHDLLSMDTFWGHVLVYLASRSKGSTLYAYNHHFWFYLAHESAEKEYNKGMETYGVKTKMLIGSKSFLDRWSTQFFGTSIRYWLHPVPLYEDERIAYNYLGGYFIEVRISVETARAIDTLFESVKTLEDVSSLELIHLFRQKTSCSITISRNRSRGEQLKKKVEKFLKKR